MAPWWCRSPPDGPSAGRLPGDGAPAAGPHPRAVIDGRLGASAGAQTAIDHWETAQDPQLCQSACAMCRQIDTETDLEDAGFARTTLTTLPGWSSSGLGSSMDAD